MSLLKEIKRRKMVQVAGVYAVVAWLLVQVVATVEAPLNLPDWVDTFVILLMGIGFPITMIVSWAFNFTPDGLVRDEGGEHQAEHGGRTLEFVLIALLVVAVGWIFYRVEFGGDVSARLTANDVLPNSVAVLPFANLSPIPDNAYFAAGVHDTILNELAKIADVNVIARTSMLRYENTQMPIGDIARELRVGTIMEGSVQVAGDTVRITAQLIDPDTGAHLWSENYDRDLDDIFAVQTDIATRIALALEAELTPDELSNIGREPTDSPEAYALYLRAMALGGDNASALADPRINQNMEALLDRAIELDPRFALARAQRASLTATTLVANIGSLEAYAERRAELEAAAIADLDAALAVDPNLGAAYAALGTIHQFNWHGRDAAAAYERALELSPKDPYVLSVYARFNSMIGNHDIGIRYARQAVELDPNTVGRHVWLASGYLASGDLDELIEAGLLASELAPTLGNSLHDMTHAEIVRGNFDSALEYARAGEDLFSLSTNPVFLSVIAHAYGRLGRIEDAGRVAARIEEIATTERIALIVRHNMAMAVGEYGEALEWLERTAATREPYGGHYTTIFTKHNFYQNPVLDRPEFVAVRERLGFID